MRWSRHLSVVLGLVAAAVVVSGCGLMRGSSYPSQDITFIVPFAPGGTADPTTRALALEAEPLLKVKINPVNKPGGTGTIGTAEVVQAKPDGYTLGLGSTPSVAIQPLIAQIPYKGPEDYQPIVKMLEMQDILVVKADAPWKTLEEFLADAKKRPGAIKIGTPGLLNVTDLNLHGLEKAAGVKFTLTPFSGGGGEVIQNLLGGFIDAGDSYPATVKSLVEAGQLRVLGTVFGDRNPMLPNVPAAKELGYNITPVAGAYFVMGPKGMDKAVLDKLVQVFTQSVKSESFQKFIKDNGFVSDPKGPDDTSKWIKTMLDNNDKLIKDLNLKP